MFYSNSLNDMATLTGKSYLQLNQFVILDEAATQLVDKQWIQPKLLHKISRSFVGFGDVSNPTETYEFLMAKMVALNPINATIIKRLFSGGKGSAQVLSTLPIGLALKRFYKGYILNEIEVDEFHSTPDRAEGRYYQVSKSIIVEFRHVKDFKKVRVLKPFNDNPIGKVGIIDVAGVSHDHFIGVFNYINDTTDEENVILDALSIFDTSALPKRLQKIKDPLKLFLEIRDIIGNNNHPGDYDALNKVWCLATEHTSKLLLNKFHM